MGNIFRINLKRQYDGIGWIYLAQDRDKWQSCVYTVMNL